MTERGSSMGVYEFLKENAAGKKVFIGINDDHILGYTIPFDEITFIEDCPVPFCCFKTRSLLSRYNESEITIMPYSRVYEFRIVDE